MYQATNMCAVTTPTGLIKHHIIWRFKAIEERLTFQQHAFTYTKHPHKFILYIYPAKK